MIQALNDQNSTVRFDATLALGEIGSPAVEPLIQALKDQNSLYAAIALVKIGKPSVEPLIQALKDNDIDVKRNAALALGTINDTRAVEPLIQALKDQNSLYTVLALVKIGKPSVEPLIQALKDHNITIRGNVKIVPSEGMPHWLSERSMIPEP